MVGFQIIILLKWNKKVIWNRRLMKDKLTKFSISSLVELGIVVGSEGGKAVARVTYSRWRSLAEWYTEDGDCSKESAVLFVARKILICDSKYDVSTVVCLTKNHHTKVTFVAGRDSWKRREVYWTDSVQEDHPLVTSRWTTYQTVSSTVRRNQCVNKPEK
jgi:hypothetical protein